MKHPIHFEEGMRQPSQQHEDLQAHQQRIASPYIVPFHAMDIQLHDQNKCRQELRPITLVE